MALQDQHKSDLQAMTNLENRTNFAESHLEKLRAKFVKLLEERVGVADGAERREPAVAAEPVTSLTSTPVAVVATTAATTITSSSIGQIKISGPKVEQQAKVIDPIFDNTINTRVAVITTHTISTILSY